MRRSPSLVLVPLLGACASLAIGATSAVAAERTVTLQMLGGSGVPQGSLPFLAKIEARASGLLYSCTGTVIAPRAVLTAGHCAFDAFGKPLPASAYTVTIGTSVVAPLADQDPAAEHLPVSSVQPYGSSTTTLHGDVAILHLAVATSAQPVALASPAEAARYGAGTAMTIAGWGKTSDAGTPSPALRQGAEAVRSNAVCLARNAYFDPRFQLCAQAPTGGASICSGDSGGPALAATTTGWVEIGVVSYHVGERCGSGPDFYARVSTLQPWIAAQVARVGATGAYRPIYSPAPSVRAVVSGRRIAITFPAATAEAASLVGGYRVSLRNRSGRVIGSSASTKAARASFASPRPGRYTVSVATRWVAGPTLSTSASVTIAAVRGRAAPR